MFRIFLIPDYFFWRNTIDVLHFIFLPTKTSTSHPGYHFWTCWLPSTLHARLLNSFPLYTIAFVSNRRHTFKTSLNASYNTMLKNKTDHFKPGRTTVLFPQRVCHRSFQACLRWCSKCSQDKIAIIAAGKLKIHRTNSYLVFNCTFTKSFVQIHKQNNCSVIHLFHNANAHIHVHVQQNLPRCSLFSSIASFRSVHLILLLWCCSCMTGALKHSVHRMKVCNFSNNLSLVAFFGNEQEEKRACLHWPTSITHYPTCFHPKIQSTLRWNPSAPNPYVCPVTCAPHFSSSAFIGGNRFLRLPQSFVVHDLSSIAMFWRIHMWTTHSSLS